MKRRHFRRSAAHGKTMFYARLFVPINREKTLMYLKRHEKIRRNDDCCMLYVCSIDL